MKKLVTISLFFLMLIACKPSIQSAAKDSAETCNNGNCGMCAQKEEKFAKELWKKKKDNALNLTAEDAFQWPKKPDQAHLSEYTIAYAKRVGTCLGVDSQDMSDAQREWVKCREGICANYDAAIQSSDRNLDMLDFNRDKLCTIVKRDLVEKTYEGGECLQYGNCGEGARVNYCLAHAAGVKNVKSCYSKNDHAFAVVLNDKDELCVLDRWNIEKSGFYYCHKDMKIKDGVLFHAAGTGKAIPGEPLPPSDAEWYKDVGCYDPLLNGGLDSNLSAESWKQEDSYRAN